MATTQYIGARYVPLFAEPAQWDKTMQYEPLTIVLDNGNSYTSRQFVPAGIEVTNDAFWALTGNYNAQVEQYRQEVKAYDLRITTAQSTADNALALAKTNESDIAANDAELAGTADSGLKKLITDETARAKSAEEANAAEIVSINSAVNAINSNINLINSNKLYIAKNVDEMKKIDASVGCYIQTISFDNYENSGGLYVVGNDTQNGFDIIQLNNGHTAALIIDDSTNVLTLGYKPDNDCSEYLTRLLSLKNHIKFYPNVSYTFKTHVPIAKNCYIDFGNSTLNVYGKDSRNVAFLYVSSDIKLEVRNATINCIGNFNTTYTEGSYVTSNIIPIFCDSRCDVVANNVTAINALCFYKNDNNLNEVGEDVYSNVELSFIDCTGYGLAYGVNINCTIRNCKSLRINNSVNTGKAHTVYLYGASKCNVDDCYIENYGNGYQSAFNIRVKASNLFVRNTRVITHAVLWCEPKNSTATFESCNITDSYGINNLGGITANGSTVKMRHCTYNGVSLIRSNNIVTDEATLEINDCDMKLSENLVLYTDSNVKYNVYIRDSNIELNNNSYIFQVRDSRFNIRALNTEFIINADAASTALNLQSKNTDQTGTFIGCNFYVTYVYYAETTSTNVSYFKLCSTTGVRFNSRIGSDANKLIGCIYNNVFNA